MSPRHRRTPDRPTRSLLLLLALSLLGSGCKSPRSPREVATESVTGTWTARSVVSYTPPTSEEELHWRFGLEQREAGKLRGSGEVTRVGRASTFELEGIRDESTVNFQFSLNGEPAKYDGSIMDAETMVGQMYLPGDTIPVTLTRER